MPVRKIPKNHLVVTGGYASAKVDRLVEFESLLEKEHMLLLDFDDTVDRYEEQPVRIPVPGVHQGYVVDLIVHRRHGQSTQLVEVKPQEFLDRYATEYAPKFTAAEAYCGDRGWEFIKRTEHDIRTPRLANLKFLRSYRKITPTAEQHQCVQRVMADLKGRSTSERLLNELGAAERETWLPVIWHMLLLGDLISDIDVELPVDVPLSLPEGAAS